MDVRSPWDITDNQCSACQNIWSIWFQLSFLRLERRTVTTEKDRLESFELRVYDLRSRSCWRLICCLRSLNGCGSPSPYNTSKPPYFEKNVQIFSFLLKETKPKFIFSVWCWGEHGSVSFPIYSGVSEIWRSEVIPHADVRLVELHRV